MRTFAVVLGSISALVLLHGCGLDVTGYADQAEAGIVTPQIDADITESGTSSGTGNEGGTLVDTSPTCSCATPPSGWELVAYANDRNTACGTGLKTDERVTGPTAGADACSCDCQVKTTPSCNKGNFTSKRDSSGTAKCDDAASVTDANDGNCQRLSATLANHRQAVPPPPSGPGTCDAPAVQHPDKVTSAQVRVCAAKTSASCVCNPNGSFRTCVRKDGDQTCPTGYPSKHSVGTAAGVTCTACGCNVTATCSGTITFYSDQNCQTAVEVIDDKSCQTETANSFSSLKWTGTPNATCNLTSASTPTGSLASPETICCPP